MNTIGFTKQWASFPPAVRNGILATVFGWLTHWLFLALFFFTRQEPIPMDQFSRQLILGLLVFYFLWKGKAWGRWLVITGNVMIVLYYIQWFTLYRPNSLEAIAIIIIIGAFIVSSFYLLQKETAQHFNRNIAQNRPKDTTTNDSAS